MSYGAEKYVLVCDAFRSNTNNIFYSTNGTSWMLPFFKIPEEARSVFDVAFGVNKFVAVAAGGFVYASADVFFWERSANPVGVGYRISYCNGIFISPSSPGLNALSRDGLSWTTVSTGVTGLLDRVIYVNGTFYARSGNHLVISTNGTNWTERLNSNLPGDVYASIASDGSRLVTVGFTPSGNNDPTAANGFIYTSDPFTSLGITHAPPPQLILSGLVGRSYRIEYLPSVPASAANQWQTLTNLSLPNSPYLLSDPETPNSTHRYYRAVLLP